MLISGGVMVKGPTVLWSGTTTAWPSHLELSGRWASYGEIYRRQLWVYVVARKRANALARLPLRVYRGPPEDREAVADSGYATLLARPNAKYSPFRFWSAASATRDIYGEMFWGKERASAGGQVVGLMPLHPACMHPVEEDSDRRTVWRFDNGRVRIDRIPARDLVHIRDYNPDDPVRGLSPLEPLRATLENEDAARRATSAFWRNAGRPSVALSHPGKLSQEAADRLKVDWERIHAGADNYGKVAILEEGMRPEVLSLSAEEAQYVEGRKLNRVEVCAAYDMPPTSVQILDDAKFANITEQNRALYRDTMAAILREFEDELDHQLRAEPNPRTGMPEFGDDERAIFSLDDVLRGSFESRMQALQQAINSAVMTPNEARQGDNLPPMPGGDGLLVNSTMIPLSTAIAAGPPNRTAASEPAEDDDEALRAG